MISSGYHCKCIMSILLMAVSTSRFDSRSSYRYDRRKLRHAVKERIFNFIRFIKIISYGVSDLVARSKYSRKRYHLYAKKKLLKKWREKLLASK
mmetsp:Transcript_35616/g.86191  ORF Transcript_35616/g.86191 Transcript_35616/m.86191 type:complete len:94 (-) Transcript_35616:1818-2099(-)